MTEHLRAHLEAIREEADTGRFLYATLNPEDAIREMDNSLASIQERTVAALDILNKANYTRRDGWPTTRYAYIRDPEHPDDAVYPKLPDPVPGSTIATRETHT